jgi:hypothetical protein
MIAEYRKIRYRIFAYLIFRFIASAKFPLGVPRVWVKPEHQRIVGSCLAAARKKAGVSQDELALRLQKPQSFVSAYERGQRRVDVLEFLAILAALGADPKAVFAEIEAEARLLIVPPKKRAPRKTRSPG